MEILHFEQILFPRALVFRSIKCGQQNCLAAVQGSFLKGNPLSLCPNILPHGYAVALGDPCKLWPLTILGSVIQHCGSVESRKDNYSYYSNT